MVIEVDVEVGDTQFGAGGCRNGQHHRRRTEVIDEPQATHTANGPLYSGGTSLSVGLDRGEAGRGDEALVTHAVLGGRGDLERGPPREPPGALDRLHQLEVERMAAVSGDDVPHERAAQEGEVAEEVEDLMPHELVAVAQAGQGTLVAEHDRVVEGAAAGQAVLPHEPEVLQKAVGAGG